MSVAACAEVRDISRLWTAFTTASLPKPRTSTMQHAVGRDPERGVQCASEGSLCGASGSALRVRRTGFRRQVRPTTSVGCEDLPGRRLPSGGSATSWKW